MLDKSKFKKRIVGLIEMVILGLIMFFMLGINIIMSAILGIMGVGITTLILSKTPKIKTRIILFTIWGIMFGTLVIVSNTIVDGFFICPYKIPLVGETAGVVAKIPGTDINRGIIPCPFGMIQNMISGIVNHYPITSIIITSFKIFGAIVILWLVITVVLGRVWCGWICPFGGITEFFSRIGKSERLKINWSSGVVKGLRYGFFIAVIILTLGIKSSPSAYYCNICPNKAIWHSPGQMKQMFMLVSEFIAYAGFLVFMIILPFLTKKRVWCNLICPFGTLTSTLGSFSLLTTKIDNEKCVRCKKCIKECKMAAISEKDGKIELDGLSCSNCLECSNSCPKDAIKINIRGTNINTKKYFIPIIVIVAITIITMFVMVLWKPILDEILKLIRGVIK